MEEDLEYLLPRPIVAIPHDELASFKRDPLGYLARKGATPITAAYPFYADRDAIKRSMCDLINHIDDRRMVFVSTGPFRHEMSPRYIHVDLGIEQDATGIACCHVAGETPAGLPIVEFDFLARLTPKPGFPIRVDDIEQILYDAATHGYALALITADKYGSSQMLQHLQDAGFPASHLSLDRTTTKVLVRGGEVTRVSTKGDISVPHVLFRDGLLDNRIRIPFYYPLIVQYDSDSNPIAVDHRALKHANQTWLERELSQLQKDPVTGVVIKLPTGTDDLSQAVVGAYFNLMVNEVDFETDPEVIKKRAEKEKPPEDEYYTEEAVIEMPRTDGWSRELPSPSIGIPPDSIYDDPTYKDSF